MRFAIQALVKAQRRVQLRISSPLAFYLRHSSMITMCNAEDDPKEWPGPKAWPATLALISFFAVNVFGQVAACILHHSAPLFSASQIPVHVPISDRACSWRSLHGQPIARKQWCERACQVGQTQSLSRRRNDWGLALCRRC